MMKFLVLVVCVAVVSGYYTDVDDKIDVDHLVQDPAQLRAYIDCYLDKSPCTDQMMGYKKHIVDAVANTCKNCSPLQKHKLEEVLKVAVVKFPEALVEMRKKYNIDTKHFADMAAELAKYD
ncbi:allergen Tha p 1-like [Aricia agestis]|uniref:allergen Tha p 1-like n=1 Tax=Aricia agestis TaxID=91739 RepID=UPI001C208AC4|nr:allergen Tha p 1-like [Aricia agestis]